MKTLFPHQADALAYAQTRDHIALFMEMRLGKSLVSIRWAAPFTGRRLIVAPLSTLKGWEAELLDEGVPADRICWLTGVTPRVRVSRAADLRDGWALINYEALRTWTGCHLVPWSAVICDESTKLRNPQSKISKLLTRKFVDVPHRAVLSGLPNPESLLDFYGQLLFIADDGAVMGFRNYWAWRERYFLQIGYDWVPKRDVGKGVSARDAILTYARAQSFTLTRAQAGMGSRKIYETRVVPLDPGLRRALRDIKKDFKFEGDRTLETKSSGAQFTWMQRIAGGFSPDPENPEWLSDGKLREILSLLETDLRGQQVVIWFRFNEELGAIYHALRAAGYTAVAITGATPTSPVNRRHQRQMRFQSGSAQICCIQASVGRYGLNLSAADVAIYYSNTYEYEARAQSEDRIVHLTKQRPLLYLDLVTEGTTDEDAVAVLRDKHVNAQSFMSRLLERIQARYACTPR